MGVAQKYGRFRTTPKSEQIKGGIADGLPDSMFRKKDLQQGMAVEREHTISQSKAKEITKDHIVETGELVNGKFSSQYYPELSKMEAKLKKRQRLRGPTKPGLDKQKNVLRHRVIEPKHLNRKSYLTFVIRDSQGNPTGVHLVRAKLKGRGRKKYVTQAVTFDMDKFDRKRAMAFLKRHPEYDYQG